MSEIDGRIIGELIEQLQDPNETKRRSAMTMLVRIGEPAVQPIINQFSSVWPIAISGNWLGFPVLAMIGSVSISPLIAALASEDKWTRRIASRTLLFMAQFAIHSASEVSENSIGRQEALELMTRLASLLKDALKNGDYNQRFEAGEILQRLGLL